MSLSAAIQIARSALTASQVGIQVTGNNVANALTPGYTRQVGLLRSIAGAESDIYRIGRGVQVADVARQIDESVQARLRQGVSDESRAATASGLMDQLEAAVNELTDFDFSSEINEFFSVWSEAGNLIDSQAVVVEQGDKLAQFVRSLRQELADLRTQIEEQINSVASRANELIDGVAELNRRIGTTEIDGVTANGLRDQRDALLTELSGLIDIEVIENSTRGQVDVLVGSVPIVLGGESRGLAISREVVNGALTVGVVVASDQEPLPVTGGSLGGLLGTRDGSIDETIDDLDSIASQLIFEVNKLHSTGTNQSQHTSLHADRGFSLTNRALALNDPLNADVAGLPFAATNGGFLVNVRNAATGSVNQVRIDVDLDGITATGAAGFGDDTSIEDIRAQLAAIPGLTATFTADGRLRVTADTGFEFSFAEDSSASLALVGLNSFFTGSDGTSIAIRESLLENPATLSVGRFTNGVFVENGTALGIADLSGTALASLNGLSFSDRWADRVQAIGVDASSARTSLQSAEIVRQSLESQRAALSGVSVDEESINLLNYQRQFQGAARLISIADEMITTLLQAV